MALKIERKSPWKGFPAIPEFDRRYGYELGNPSAHGIKHHRSEAVWVQTLEEAATYVEGQGYSLRMTNAGGVRGSLICPASLRITR